MLQPLTLELLMPDTVTTPIRIRRVIAASLTVRAALLAAGRWLHAASAPEPAPTKVVDPLASACRYISAQRWLAAINEPKRVNATGSADCNNLMGCALPK